MPNLDFDAPCPSPGAPSDGGTEPSPSRRARAGIGAAALIAAGKLLFGVLKLGKIAVTLASMLAFIAVDSSIFGWRLAAGLAVCILVHELGHVLVNVRHGLKASVPLFLPGMGAVILVKQFPDDPAIQSQCGAGGPAAGLLAALVCLAVGMMTGAQYWIALARIGFAMNLFNLIPFPPLDGSHIATVFSRSTWYAVLVALIVAAALLQVPMLWIIVIVGALFAVGSGHNTRYLLASQRVRLAMAAVYSGLAIALCAGMSYTLSLSGTASTPAASTTSGPAVNGPPLDAIQTVAVLVIGCLIWIGIAALWRRRTSVGLRSLLGWALGMAALYPVAVDVLVRMPARWTPPWSITGTWFAASAASLAGAIAANVHVRERDQSPGRLIAHGATWAAAGALLAAVGFRSVALVLIVVALFAVWVALHQGPALFMAAEAAISAGSEERAIGWFGAAARREPRLARHANMACASINVTAERGAAARDALERARAAGEPATGADGWRWSALMAEALVLVDDYDGALRLCEDVMQVADHESADERFMTVRSIGARLALLRGWDDETVHQADQLAAYYWRRQPERAAMSTLLRARALLDRSELQQALAAADRARVQCHVSHVEALAAAVRAEALRLADPAAAHRSALMAIRTWPANLFVRLAAARVLRSKATDGTAHGWLRELAGWYPRDHWGRAAQSELASAGAA